LVLERYGKSTVARIARARAAFERLKTELVERNLRLVLKVARQFSSGPMSFEDLIGEGNVGLMRATESFNGRFDVRFSTYAFTWIRQAILRALEEKGRTIRLPVQLNQLLRRARRQGGVTDLRDAVGLTEREKKRLASVAPNPAVLHGVRSLNGGSASNDGSSFADSLPDRELPRPDHSILAEDVPQIVRGSLTSLSLRKQSILGLRFGLIDGLPKTLVEIAASIGLSSERVRQIQVEALSELRGGPAAQMLEDALPIR
jgi:RNA polymerase primary sigma factor